MPDPKPHDPLSPEPASKATQRLSGGVPPNPYSTQPLDLSKRLEAIGERKVTLSGAEADPEETRKLVLPSGDEAPVPVLDVDPAAGPAGWTPRPRDLAPGAGWKLPATLGALVVLGAAYWAFARRPAPRAPSRTSAPETLPPGAQLYLDQAKSGDTQAMRMLGAMYYYGLNVPQDREKGLFWYRKAAAAGSEAARSELSKIEGGR